MAFKLLSASIALIFVFNRYLEVLASPALSAVTAHGTSALAPTKQYAGKIANNVVHDASNEKLEDIRNGPWKNLGAISVPDHFLGTVPLVMEGNGVLFQREEKIQKGQWHPFLDQMARSRTKLENHYAKHLGWDGAYPKAEEPEMIDERHVNDPKWVKFEPAQFPVKLPVDTAHHMAWIRAPMTTEKCFEPVHGEAYPADYKEWKANLGNYIEFIHGHDVFGTNVGLKEAHMKEEDLAKDLMRVTDSEELEEALKTEQELKAGEVAGKQIGGDPPHIQRGKRAMLWSGRNITRLIAAKYPGRRFAWFRVNRWIRTHHLNQIHIFLEKTPEEAQEAKRLEQIAQQLKSSHLHQSGDKGLPTMVIP